MSESLMFSSVAFLLSFRLGLRRMESVFGCSFWLALEVSFCIVILFVPSCHYHSSTLDRGPIAYSSLIELSVLSFANLKDTCATAIFLRSRRAPSWRELASQVNNRADVLTRFCRDHGLECRRDDPRFGQRQLQEERLSLSEAPSRARQRDSSSHSCGLSPRRCRDNRRL
jgi:hypothetical protein